MKKENDMAVFDFSIENEAEKLLTLPPMYSVFLVNDDFTPMDFVVDVLKKFFGFSEGSAHILMLKIHYEGCAICGVFSADVAKTKVEQVNRYAREHEHPLLCTLEK